MLQAFLLARNSSKGSIVLDNLSEVNMLFDGLNTDRATLLATFSPWQKRDVNPLGRTSKVRDLYTPNLEMKKLHEKLLKNLRRLKNVDLSSATAKTGSRIVLHVARHRHNRFFYKTDLRSAFDSVDGDRLAEVLVKLDPKISFGEMKQFLVKFCLTPLGGLITGAPSAQDLFNIYCAVLIDAPLREYCEQFDIVYSRYLDDLTFSAQEPIGARKREQIRRIVTAAGFTVGHHKSRVFDLAKAPIEINGIGLEYGGRLYLPRWYLRKIRGLIRKYDRTEDARLLHKLDGMYGLFISSMDPNGERTQLEYKTMSEYKRVRAGLRPHRV
jgi:hypothetical protein